MRVTHGVYRAGDGSCPRRHAEEKTAVADGMRKAHGILEFLAAVGSLVAALVTVLEFLA